MLPARRLAAATAILVLALVCSSSALAQKTTTQPSQNVNVYFVFTDQKLAYEILRPTVGGPNDLMLEKYVTRGSIATFYVINRGKRPHDLTFFGKTFDLKPGQKAHFKKTLLTRGSYPYRSTTDPGKAFNGVFPVV